MEVHINTEKTIRDLIEEQRHGILRVNQEYQRGLRWTLMQKRMFLDSVFRGYSIPAFYFHRKEQGAGDIRNTFLEIVDGQQRVNALYSYIEGAFDLHDPNDPASGFRFPNFVKGGDCPWGGKRYGELQEELQERLLSQNVVIYEISTPNENYIRDLFIRLQGGTPLTPQDKRDSWPGNFTEFVLRVGGKQGVDRWYGLPLYKERLKASRNESRRRQLVAQVFILFWTLRKERKFCDIKSANIDEFYHAHVDLEESSAEVKRFEKICAVLDAAFQGSPRLFGYYVIHLTLLVDALLDEYAFGWQVDLADQWGVFEERRKESVEAVRNSKDSEYSSYYYEYGQLTQTRSDDANHIRRRHVFFVQEMVKLLNPKKLDSVRGFSELERATVFYRDRKLCQWCRMNGKAHELEWDEGQVHHVVPHSEGGKTAIDNGALVGAHCHPKRHEDVARFREWWAERQK